MYNLLAKKYSKNQDLAYGPKKETSVHLTFRQIYGHTIIK